MASLNQYASRVAHLVGQPDNHSLKERIKDMIKDYFAKYIIQSIDRNGIQPYYVLKLTLELKGVERTKQVNPLFDNNFYYIDGVRQYNQDGSPKDNPKKYYYLEYETVTKVPKPMNIKSDSPFTRVSIPNSSKVFKYVPEHIIRISYTLPSTSLQLQYIYTNDVIICNRRSSKQLQNNEPLTEIEVETIWENPEEIIGYYGETDNQDLELPFPNEMFSLVILDLLKTEFNIVPKDTEIIAK